MEYRVDDRSLTPGCRRSLPSFTLGPQAPGMP